MKYALASEPFDTLQGEGERAGARSVFVRFAGCNLWSGRPEDRPKGQGACALWCDTDFRLRLKVTAEELLALMDAEWPRGDRERWCVLTGGEPTLQVDDALLVALHDAGWRVAMETNGTVDAPWLGRVDWLTVSPKRKSTVVVRRGHELKVVLPGIWGLLHADVGGWTDEELVELAPGFGSLFVQPQDAINQHTVESSFLTRRNPGGYDEYMDNVARCVTFVRAHPQWRLSVQSHKFHGLR